MKWLEAAVTHLSNRHLSRMRLKIFLAGLSVLIVNFSLGLINLATVHLLSHRGGKSLVVSFGLGNSFYILFICFLTGLTAGTVKSLSQNKGAEGAPLRTCLTVALAFSVLIVLVMSLTKGPYVSYATTNHAIETLFFLYVEGVTYAIPLLAINMVLSAFLMYRKQHGLLLRAAVAPLSLNGCALICLYFVEISPHLFIKIIAALAPFSALIMAVCLAYYSKENMPIKTIKAGSVKIGDFLAMSYTSILSSVQFTLLILGFTAWVIMASKISVEAAGVMVLTTNVFRFFSIPVRLFGSAIGAYSADKSAAGNWKSTFTIFRSGVEVACFIVWPAGVLMIFFPSFFMDCFFKDITPDLYLPSVRVVGLILLIEPIAGFLSEALRTQGIPRPGFIASAYLYVIALPLSWYWGVHQKMGIMALWLLILSCRIVTAGACLFVLQQKKQ